MKYIVQMRRGSSTQWINSNIVPLAGELVVEIDDINNLHKLKIGDGIHVYKDLAYLQAGDELVTQVLAKALPRVVTIELTTNWTKGADDKYSQIIKLEGITNHSRLDLQPSADMLAEFKQLGLVFVTENNGGAIAVYSVGNMPLKSYIMQATIVETECNGDDISIVGAPVGTPVAQSDWGQTDDTKADFIKNKPTFGAMAAKDSVSKTDLTTDIQTSLDKADNAMPSTESVVKYTAQVLTDAQKAQVRANIGAGESGFSGDYNDLKNKPSTFPPSTHTHDYIPVIQKGAANGVAELDENGKVPTAQLPSYVDDVLEYSAKSSFPSTGEAGKIYIDTSTNITYRWSGSVYVEISASLALGNNSSTAFRGDYGNTAYTHSQKTSGNPHGVTKSDVGLENVENKSSDTIRGEITSANVTDALGFTPLDSKNAYNHPTSHPASMITGLATVATSGNYNDLNNKPTIPDSLSDLTDDAMHRTVTDTEKATWNATNERADSAYDLANTAKTTADGKADAVHEHNDVYYTKTEIDGFELITLDDIDAICGFSLNE